uniref:Uncharacterized protein n=1 Tax=Anguilla anguilla TaxID=7936 RepID=A0A0E9WUH6_ANGAN
MSNPLLHSPTSPRVLFHTTCDCITLQEN